MASASPDSLFVAAVKEKHKAAITRLGNCQRALISDDRNVKARAAEELSQSLDRLAEILPSNYRPKWIARLQKAATTFAEWPENDDAKLALHDELSVGGLQCRRQEWDFSRDGIYEPIDFNSVAQGALAESQIPNLFDLLIDQLEECIAKDYVDSSRARSAIERLLATLRARESRTFFGTIATGRFAQRFVRNFLLDELKKLPVAGGIVNALEKTAAQLAEEDAKLLERVNSQTQALAKAELEGLSTKMTPYVEALRLHDLSTECCQGNDGVE